jgi:hypothetical protein
VTWYNISNFAFGLEKLEFFLHEPGHLEGGVPVPAVTTVFFNGHSAVVPDPKGELHRFLLEKREFIEPEPVPIKQGPPPLPPQG